jgi:hypothetical protein
MVDDPHAREQEQSTFVIVFAEQVEKGNILIKYCPTNQMIGDFSQNHCKARKLCVYELAKRVFRQSTGVCKKDPMAKRN